MSLEERKNAMVSKAETLVWYLRRPSLYRELGRRVFHRRFSTPRSAAEAAEEKRRGQVWCESVVTTEDALFAELGVTGPRRPLAELHPAAWAEAQRAVEACPVKMGGPANLDLLYHLVRHLRPDTVLETGVANGWSTLAITLALEENRRGVLFSVDMPYAKMNNEAYVGCAVPASLRHRFTLFRLPDRDAIPKILGQNPRLDFAHYDSDKSHEGRMWAYERIWAALRPGGVLMSDDVEDNSAFREFATHTGRRPWVLKKPKPGNFAGLLVR